MSQIVVKKNGAVLTAAVLMSVMGLVTVTVGALWLAGSLGISTAAASQIVSAIVAGGWALRAVILIFGAGLIGAVTATVLWYVSSKGKAAAIA